MKLTKKEVLEVVKDWYCNGSYPDILQNESGYDLEEILEREIDGFPIRDHEELNLNND
tara:strand:- start:290 stop:463 length:174 start_codon:yes stop_codon:yes gene_type:complete